MLYVEFTLKADTTWFLRGHQRAFAYFGGVPREVLHNNLKSAVLGRDPYGNVLWNERYLDFAAASGFVPHACAPYRAQTKGKVERSISYVRANFWNGLQFSELTDLNQQVLDWLNQVANPRLHGTTGVSSPQFVKTKVCVDFQGISGGRHLQKGVDAALIVIMKLLINRFDLLTRGFKAVNIAQLGFETPIKGFHEAILPRRSDSAHRN